MERTLYLSESRSLRVRCDGPSLLVEQRGQAPRRVPARLIRRVVIVGNVALDSGTLGLFATRGCPVTLLSRDGQPVATVWGQDEGDAQRRARQEALLEDRVRRQRVLAWLAAWERGRQLVLVSRVDPARAAAWRKTGFRGCDYEEVVRAAAAARHRADGLRRFFRGALQETVAAAVAAAGWDPHLGVRHRSQPLGFVKDCVAALRPDADRLWVEFEGAMVSAAAAAFFETNRGRLEGLIRLLLDQYARLLCEV